VTYITWFDGARFANWMHNGQPTGPQNSATTESGSYSLNGAMSGNSFIRNSGATYCLPSLNEWYKAAYYQPAAAGGDTDGYWLYPMQTNSTPYSDQPPGVTPDNTRVANYYGDDGIANGYNDGYAVSGLTTSPVGNVLTPVGAYTSSDSYYGTYDQGGNAWEWTDTVDQSNRWLGGGSWLDSPANGRLNSNNNYTQVPTVAQDNFGFRLAAVPEPTGIVPGLLCLGAAAMRRRRRR